MTIHITNAQSIGSIVVEGKHKPFRALACPLGCIPREVNVADDFAKLDCSAIDLPWQIVVAPLTAALQR